MTDFPCCDPAPSPATPPGREARGRVLFEISTPEAGFPAVSAEDAARYVSPDSKVGKTRHAAPSPASPAETAAWTVEDLPGLFHGWLTELAETPPDLIEPFRVMARDAIAYIDGARAASPAVSLPGEQPGGDEDPRIEAWDRGWRVGRSGQEIRNPYRPALPGERADEEPS